MSEDHKWSQKIIHIRIQEGESGSSKYLNVNAGSIKSLKSFYKCVTSQKQFSDISFTNKNQVDGDLSRYLIERKSKKTGGYTALSSADDFKGLLRSLEVKDKVKIRIFAREPSTVKSEKLHSIDKAAECTDKVSKALKDISLSSTNGQNYRRNTPLVLLNISGTTHNNIICDGCGEGDDDYISGARHKCLDCFDYDLCEKCFKQPKYSESHKEDHRMVLIAPVSPDEDEQPLMASEDEKPSQVLGVSEEFFDKNDSLIDISFEDKQHRDETVKLIRKFDSFEKIQILNEIYNTHSSLKPLLEEHPGANIADIVRSHFDQKKREEEAQLEHKSIIVLFEIWESPAKMDSYLRFKVINKSSVALPPKMFLSFTHEQKDPPKLSFRVQHSLGSESIIPNGHKTGLHKLNEDFTRKLFDNPNSYIKVELLLSGKLYAGKTAVDNFGLNEVKLTNSLENDLGTNVDQNSSQTDTPEPTTTEFMTAESSSILGLPQRDVSPNFITVDDDTNDADIHDLTNDIITDFSESEDRDIKQTIEPSGAEDDGDDDTLNDYHILSTDDCLSDY